MTTIKFSDSELKDLKSFYQLELDKANTRVQDIKGILSKFNSRQTTNGQTVTAGLLKIKPSRTYDKRIPWRDFILDTFKQQNKLLRSTQLYDMAYRQFKITDNKEKENALKNIRGHLLRMSRRKEIIAHQKKGQQDILYGVKLNSRQTTNGQTVNIRQFKVHRTDNLPDDKQRKITVGGSGISPIGRKMGKWPIFILDTMEQQNKFLKSRQLYDMAYRQFKITDKKEKHKTLRNIRGHLLRMSSRKEIIARQKKGQQDKQYGLITWADKK